MQFCFGRADIWKEDNVDEHTRSAVVDERASLQTLWPYLLQHGKHCLAWSVLQDGMRHFLLSGVGFIAYTATQQPAWSKVLVLGDPVAPPSRWRELLRALIAKYKRATFVHTSHAFAVLISEELGYEVNSMGGETVLSLAKYTFTGNDAKSVRLDAGRAQRAGVVVEEIARVSDDVALPASLSRRLREVSRSWERSKQATAARAWFTVRPPLYEDEPTGTRIFVAWAPATLHDVSEEAETDVTTVSSCGSAAGATATTCANGDPKEGGAVGAGSDSRTDNSSRCCLPCARAVSHGSKGGVAPFPCTAAADTHHATQNGNVQYPTSSPNVICSPNTAIQHACNLAKCAEMATGPDEGNGRLWKPLTTQPSAGNNTTKVVAACDSTLHPIVQPHINNALGKAKQGGCEETQSALPAAAAAVVSAPAVHMRPAGRRVVAFMVLDPMHQSGRLIGYYRNVIRTLDIAHKGTVSLMTKVVIETLCREKASVVAATAADADTPPPEAPVAAAAAAPGGLVLSLGLSPGFYRREDPSAFKHNPLVRWWYDWLWVHGQTFYPFQGIAMAKAKYGGGASTLETTGRYSHAAATLCSCWIASGAGVLALWEQYKMGLTTGLVHGGWLRNSRLLVTSTIHRSSAGSKTTGSNTAASTGRSSKVSSTNKHDANTLRPSQSRFRRRGPK